MLKLKLQYFGHLTWRVDLLEKTLMLEGLGAGEGDDRGWDGWMASLTQWTWVWVNSRSWWWTGRLACCDSWGPKESDTTERLNWTECKYGESMKWKKGGDTSVWNGCIFQVSWFIMYLIFQKEKPFFEPMKYLGQLYSNYQNLEAITISLNKWMDKLVYPGNEVLLSTKNKWATNTWNNKEET